jgi:hypothetical protein
VNELTNFILQIKVNRLYSLNLCDGFSVAQMSCLMLIIELLVFYYPIEVIDWSICKEAMVKKRLSLFRNCTVRTCMDTLKY